MPSTRYIYADLDALNQDVCTYMRAHSKEFSGAALSEHYPISAYKLTELLSQPGGVTKYFHGSYYHLKLQDVEAFRASGWQMRAKSASKYRTLGDLPKPRCIPTDDDTGESKTLVLVAGKLAASVLHGVDRYFDAGWRVQCYCLRDKDAKVYNQLAADRPSHFQYTYLDSSVQRLIKDISADYDKMLPAKAAFREDAAKFFSGASTHPSESAVQLNYNLSSLYKHIYQLQEKRIGMEVDSEDQRTRQIDAMMHRIQHQKDVFEFQLSNQGEELKERLMGHRNTTTLLHHRHELFLDEYMKNGSTDVETALSHTGELSEQVKQDILYEYRRTRINKEFTRWRKGISNKCIPTAKINDQVTYASSTCLDIVDIFLKQNGIQSGITNWRSTLVVLIIHKATAWLSSASYGKDFVGVMTTSIAVVVIALSFVDVL
ncbi:unnamed protein product [Phytophthora fragariaefolia]|uniref:Unnamed protein product n=1 Tax=Phytophthora fragariaefolia TaxID=1490495 RepID=A0A9W6WXZ7_9STRA|nr:unnamed protein product [Phytophthora fragariaefolia]